MRLRFLYRVMADKSSKCVSGIRPPPHAGVGRAPKLEPAGCSHCACGLPDSLLCAAYARRHARGSQGARALRHGRGRHGRHPHLRQPRLRGEPDLPDMAACKVALQPLSPCHLLTLSCKHVASSACSKDPKSPLAPTRGRTPQRHTSPAARLRLTRTAGLLSAALCGAWPSLCACPQAVSCQTCGYCGAGLHDLRLAEEEGHPAEDVPLPG